jgi:hypothetical protein
MSGQKIWTLYEDDLMRSLFPDYAAIRRAIPHRTYFACRARARALGLVIKRPQFTARELSVIRRAYPSGERDEIMALLPGRNWPQVRDFANRKGITGFQSHSFRQGW